MSPSKRFLYLNLILLSCILALAFYSYRNSLSFVRSPNSLITRFFSLKNKNPRAAIRVLEIILKDHPNNKIALENLLEMQLSQKKYSDALRTLKRIEAVSPTSDTLLLKEAFTYQALGNQNKACYTFNKTLLSNSASLLQKQQSLLALQKCFEQSTYDNQLNNRRLTFIDSLLNAFTKMELVGTEHAIDVLNLAEILSPDNVDVLNTKGYYFLRHKDYLKALFYFNKSLHNRSNPKISLELSYLYLELNEQKKSLDIFSNIKQDLTINETIAYTKDFINKSKPLATQSLSLANSINDSLQKELYALRKKSLALLKKGKYTEALKYQKKSFALNASSEMAMEMGYTYQKLNDLRESYRCFNLAKKSPDQAIRYRAEIALKNISGNQHKIIPEPYFTDLYLAPFYFSRFDLAVLPAILKVGKRLQDRFDSDLYFSTRYTKDDRSSTSGQLEQIFEDNVAIIALGYSNRPVYSLPMRFFVEVGIAKDLIWRDRNEYRFDVRSGLFYAKRWKKLSATPKKEIFSLNKLTELYLDLIYFSRYDNNIILTGRASHALNIFQNNKLSINAYAMFRGSTDKNREFYNNLIEYGPGISLTPTNIQSLSLSIERRLGTYLPVKNSDNPYSTHYNNTVIQLLFYTRL